jgi:hypothetical protein
VTYAEKVDFFRKAFAEIPLAEFDGPEAFREFRRMSAYAVRVAGHPVDDEWPLAALDVLCEGSPAAKEYFRSERQLS